MPRTASRKVVNVADYTMEMVRRDPGGATIPWVLNADGTDPVADAVARTRLQEVVDGLADVVAALQATTSDVTDRVGRLLGHVIVDSAPTTAVTGAFYPATQPVSAAALPLPAGAATQATLANVALEITLQLVLDKLGDLLVAVNGLDITSESIEIASENIALQTDDLEALVAAVRDRLPATLHADGGVKTHAQNVPIDYPDAATLAKVEQVRALLAAPLPVTGPLTDAQARAAPLPVSGTVTISDGSGPVTVDGTVAVSGTVPVSGFPADQKVHDDYATGEVLPDQIGAGAVLTFTFSAAVQLVLVHAYSATATDLARVDPFGGTPSASAGIRALNDVPTFIPVTATVVKVYAPTGMEVSVSGFRRA